jgi:predicted enzyme related to lactoylglutathione lyase
MDRENLPAPTEGFVLTHFLTVDDVARSRRFYAEVLGGTIVLEENPCMIRIANSWIIMNPGGGPTEDKPDVTLRPPSDPQTASSFMNIRVADIHACYEDWSAKGARFLTPPIDREAELRCYMRDPDGYLIEVGQSTGLLEGHLARPTG